jgi:hypothetical protein
MMIGAIIVGILLCLFSAVIWMWRNKSKFNIKKGDKEFMKNFSVDKKQINKLKQQTTKLDKKDKSWDNVNKIKTKKNLWNKFVDWFLCKNEGNK